MVSVAVTEVARYRCDTLQPIEITDSVAEQAHQLSPLLSEIIFEELAEAGIQRKQLAVEDLRHRIGGGRPSGKVLLDRLGLFRSHGPTISANQSRRCSRGRAA